MTSNRFFFKIMKEDLRHKIWMMALSVLTSTLMLPVVWLIWWSNRSGSGATDALFLLEENRPKAILQTIDFFRGHFMLAGGFQTVAGALVTGLSGFRYVFHKNMVDTYHSMPVKRSTLFASGYLNGILIWMGARQQRKAQRWKRKPCRKQALFQRWTARRCRTERRRKRIPWRFTSRTGLRWRSCSRCSASRSLPAAT